jgi:hypothetical protein
VHSCDKKITAFLPKHFSRAEYKNIKHIYKEARCEQMFCFVMLEDIKYLKIKNDKIKHFKSSFC